MSLRNTCENERSYFRASGNLPCPAWVAWIPAFATVTVVYLRGNKGASERGHLQAMRLYTEFRDDS